MIIFWLWLKVFFMPCIAKVSLLYSTVSSVVCTIISWKFLGTIIFVHTLTIVSNSFKVNGYTLKGSSAAIFNFVFHLSGVQCLQDGMCSCRSKTGSHKRKRKNMEVCKVYAVLMRAYETSFSMKTNCAGKKKESCLEFM